MDTKPTTEKSSYQNVAFQRDEAQGVLTIDGATEQVRRA